MNSCQKSRGPRTGQRQGVKGAQNCSADGRVIEPSKKKIVLRKLDLREVSEFLM